MASACKFAGPAGSEFDSFEEQTVSMLNNSCPGWNGDKSYIIPPIFYYQHPEMPDHEIEAMKQEGTFDRDVIDRTSDAAEHMVFDALNALAISGFAAPFVTIHSLNLNRISASLSRIFPGLPPNVTNQKFGEYDFVLIGPQIGITVIEVKSTSFTQARDFRSDQPMQHQRLPEQYKKGIEQLRSFDTVLGLLERVTGASVNREHVRRILFTPNLKRARYDDWLNRLDESSRNDVIDSVKGSNCWFWEDTQSASQLIDKLRSYLNGSHDTHSLPSSAFECCVPILTGLASVTIAKTSVVLDSKAMSMEETVLRVSYCIEAQDPWSLEPPRKRRKREPPKPTFETIDVDKAIIFTPEQSAALRGPPKQFILGAAGTGKTIILQARALELLRKGESVLIFCSDYFVGYYVHLFERHKLKRVTVESWPKRNASLRSKIIKARTKPPTTNANRFIREGLEDLMNGSLANEEDFNSLTSYDHILIDDALVNESTHGLDRREVPLCIMYVKLIAEYIGSHLKSVWVALDPFADLRYYYSWDPRAEPGAHEPLDNVINRVATSFGISYLKRVMRNPENIFQPLLQGLTIYPFQMSRIGPLIGHKIQGSQSFVIATSFDSVTTEIINLLENFKNYPLDQIAIILGECTLRPQRDLRCKLTKAVRNYLIKYLVKRSIPCKYIGSIEKKADKSSRGKLIIYDWVDVPSMEWPLVIYLSLQYRDKSHVSDSFARFRKYLACSRTTGILAEIALDVASFCPDYKRGVYKVMR